MEKKEVEKIIKEEGLSRINLFKEQEVRENQVGITKKHDKWIVYVTDERASIVDTSVTQFTDESMAYEMLIRKGRYAEKRFG
jgi:hypothetical protein